MRKPTILMTVSVVLLLVIAQGTVLAAPLPQENSTPIYGQLGVIQELPQPQYDDFFQSLDGEMYGIVGIDATIERAQAPGKSPPQRKCRFGARCMSVSTMSAGAKSS